MLANKPVMTVVAYLLMFTGFGLMFRSVMVDANPQNIQMLLGSMAAGFVITMVSIGMFFYLIWTHGKILREQRELGTTQEGLERGENS